MSSDTSLTPTSSTSMQGLATLKYRRYHNRDDVAYLLPDDNEGTLLLFVILHVKVINEGFQRMIDCISSIGL